MSIRRPVSLLAIALVGAMICSAGVASAYVIPMLERRITSDTSSQSAPDISGTNVVYSDNRNGNTDIYAYDLKTGKERQLTTDGSSQDAPSISGTKVVYRDGRKYNVGDIYLYDLSTGQERQLTDDDLAQSNPRISGSKVVYEGRVSVSPADIYVYDLSTGKESKLTTGPAGASLPAISGNRVVYAAGGDIYLHDLATGIGTTLTTDPAIEGQPSISGTNVAYMRMSSSGDYDIYLHDLTTGTDDLLVTDPADQRSPRISGDRVVYWDQRNADSDVRLFDLASGLDRQLTVGPYDQYVPAIEGDRVVYTDSRDGDYNVYLGELAAPRISASTPGVVAYGAKATVTGSLATFSGIPLAELGVVLETSTDGSTWTQRSAMLTDPNGRYSLPSQALMSATYVRVRFKGDASYLSASSSSMRVQPRAKLSNPLAPSGMSKASYYTVSGTVWPTHTSGSPVRIYRWKRTSTGAWKPYGYVTAKTGAAASGGSRYSVRLRLASAGVWRLRSYHADAGHAATWSSGYDHVTVR